MTVHRPRISGVEHRFKAHDPERGRRMLERLGSMPGILLQERAMWVVWTGRNLSVCPVPDTDPQAVSVEFTFAGRPQIVEFVMGREDKEEEKVIAKKVSQSENVPLPPITTSVSASPSHPPGPKSARSTTATPQPHQLNLRELPGNTVTLKTITDPSHIRFFQTLSEAAAFARVGPDANGNIDHIVGGSAMHPVFYVVPVGPSLGPKNEEVVGNVTGGSHRVWVRQ